MKKFLCAFCAGLLVTYLAAWIFNRRRAGKRLHFASIGVIGSADGPTVIRVK